MMEFDKNFEILMQIGVGTSTITLTVAKLVIFSIF